MTDDECREIVARMRLSYEGRRCDPTPGLFSLIRAGERAGIAAERARLHKALEFYASGNHLQMPEFWDSCSGEHPMWLFPESQDGHDCDTMVEGGWIARQAIEGDAMPWLDSSGRLIDEDDTLVDAARAALKE
jgi:hypothetical protein